MSMLTYAKTDTAGFIDPLNIKVLDAISKIDKYTTVIVSDMEAGRLRLLAYNYLGQRRDLAFVLRQFNRVNDDRTVTAGSQFRIPDLNTVLAILSKYST